MARIKLTKNELKAQRDALRRFERYLPTLQLKKQQLQLEVRQYEARVETLRARERERLEAIGVWVRLFSEPVEVERYLRVREVVREDGNIAGVPVPMVTDVAFDREEPDLFATPAWVDDAIEALEEMLRVRIERETAEIGLDRLAAELRTTNQRVNLFEKVKIPEAKENLRRIRIFLGDQMTAAVARSKIAKGKSAARDEAA
jgi:V/A-type H+/Na+-transporting ATPase subunit D